MIYFNTVWYEMNTLVWIAVEILVVGIPICVGYLRMNFATGIYEKHGY